MKQGACLVEELSWRDSRCRDMLFHAVEQWRHINNNNKLDILLPAMHQICEILHISVR
jgi:hypothetical protein